MRAFLFYIDDWLSSKHIARMDAAEERGYLRLLLYAATEPDCGLPVDEDELANISLLGAQWNKPTADESRRFKDKTSGQKIMAAFIEKDGRLFNERLLREFAHQKEVSERRAASGKKGGLASKYSREAAIGKQMPEQMPEQMLEQMLEQLVKQTGQQKSTNDVWVCASPIIDISSKKKEQGETSSRFEEWFSVWSAVRGTNHKPDAVQAWVSTVTVNNEQAVFACTESYLASIDGSAGYNPENFIFDQFRGGFAARWPPRKRDPVSDRKQRDREKFALMVDRDSGKGLLA